MIHPNYKKPKIDSGDLRIKIEFWRKTGSGPLPGSSKKEKKYECMAQVYNPSMKDLEILSVKGTKEGLTIKIRDPHEDYLPTNTDFVKVDDYRYGTEKEWNIIDVSFDFEDNRFVKIVLGATS